MSITDAVAKSSGGPNIQELDQTEQEKESDGYFVREFFWDKIVIFLTTAIIGLTVVDILTELLRGGNGVVCFIPDDLNYSETQISYVSSVCSQSVPDAQYLPIFVLIHGVLIGVWHYIWKSSFSSYFDYFFSLTSHLVRLRDEISGEYPPTNIQIISRLETDFLTYKNSKMLIWYRIKLICQFITAVVSILISFFLFNDFNVDFNCMWRDPSAGVEDVEIPCIFASLRLFFLVRIFDTILLVLIILTVFFALLWTFFRHTAELDPKTEAVFSFTTGMSSDHYLPKPLLSKQGLSRLFVPRMKTDFDFLLMALYKTDSGLAHTFKEGQVHWEKQKLVEAEIRYLTTYEFIDEDKTAAKDDKRIAPRWTIPLSAKVEFETIPVPKPLQIPGDIVGAVMGFGLRAPDNEYALDVSFGSLGFSPALARVFITVGSLNFDPSYKNKDKPVDLYKFPTNLTTLHCHSDIFSLKTELSNQFTKLTTDMIWSRNYKIGFMVIGPVPDREHISTLTKLLNRFDSFFEEDAILLTVVPKQIEGKKTKFCSFRPSDKLFKPLADNHVKCVSGPLSWPPPDTTRDFQTTNTYSLECGQTMCTYELTAYKFDPEESESSEEETSSEEDDSSSVKETKKSGDKASDKVPLLEASEGRSSGLAKVGNPQANVKELNTKDVEIEIEQLNRQ